MQMETKFITQTMKLKDAFPDCAGEFAPEYGIDGESVFVRKGLVPAEVAFDEGEHASWDYITTGVKDRDNEIVDPAGGVFEDYMKNPVVLFGHDHRGMPIGKCTDIKVGKSNIAAKTVYANTAQANEIYDYRKAGFPMAKSIGFIPLKTTRFDPDSDEGKQGITRKYDKWILLEYSDVPVPSNPEALQIAISKGLLSENQAEEFATIFGEEKGVIPFHDYGKVPESEAWDGPAEVEAADVPALRRMCAWYDSANPDLKGSYKLPHHKASGGNPCVWRATAAAMAVLMGGRGGVEIPAGDRRGVFSHLAKHYAQFDKDPPEFKDFEEIEEAVEKPGWDETENFFHRQVRPPELFRKGTMKNVPIKKDAPRVSSVMGKFKSNEGKPDDPMIIQTLLFPKEDGWTLASAKTWVAAHGDLLKMYEYVLANFVWVGEMDWAGALSGLTTSAGHDGGEDTEKSGRVLSGKNREMIGKAVSAMKDAVVVLGELLALTEPATEENAVKQDTVKVNYPHEPENQFIVYSNFPFKDKLEKIKNSIHKIFEEELETHATK